MQLIQQSIGNDYLKFCLHEQLDYVYWIVFYAIKSKLRLAKRLHRCNFLSRVFIAKYGNIGSAELRLTTFLKHKDDHFKIA
jgi:hypothetical protein